jgi:starch phosphorylase
MKETTGPLQTIVWSRRFAGYKRADLVMYDWNRFLNLVGSTKFPVQFIWAGKPYPEDMEANRLFNEILTRMKSFANCAVLTGYELGLSALLKKGSDVWLNNPKMYREASGTSGMTAAMNGSINLSLPDGWVPEFARDKENCFLISAAADRNSDSVIDAAENKSLLDILEQTVLPIYYQDHAEWLAILKKAAADVEPAFESGRMADEYYRKMYN